MLKSCFRPAMVYAGGGRRGGGDSLMWHKDLKPHSVGDFSMAAVQANANLEDQGQVYSANSATYIGVYDGHGGPEASRFLKCHLFPQLENIFMGPVFASFSWTRPSLYSFFYCAAEWGFASEQGGMSVEVITKAVYAIEEGFLHHVKKTWPAKPNIISAGSCCLIGAISDNTLYVANVGDSRAVLGTSLPKRKSFQPERLSAEHNVAREEVRRELEALHPDDSHIVVLRQGVWRLKGIIQVSRSIGDIYLKKPEFNNDPLYSQFGYPVPIHKPVMTAEPSIQVRELKPEDKFVIFASDGLWEQLSDQEAVNLVQNNPRTSIAKRLVKAALEEAARKREMRYSDLRKIEKGIRRHFHDDITVIVIYLDHELLNSPSKQSPKNRKGQDCTSVPVDIFSSQSLRVHEIE